MGKRGTKPTPTAQLKLRGSWRGDINKNEPEVEVGIPEMPDFVQGNSKACWDELAPMLAGIKVLTLQDKFALSLLCETYANWRRSQDLLDKHGDVFELKDDNGETKYLQQTPYVAMVRNFGLQFKNMLCEFGLTPSARSRIQTVPDSRTQKADERMNYFSS
jgi:P27 family predicted phage terminase small subunit